MRIPDFARAKLRKSKKAHVKALFTALFVVVVAALLIPVHGTTQRTRATVSPTPSASIVNGKAVEHGFVSGSDSGLPGTARLPGKATASPGTSPSAAATMVAPAPIAGASYAGSVVLNATGSQLTSWNQTSSFCSENSWELADGTVSTDSSGDAVLATTGKSGSCVGLISPGAYSSAVIEAYIYFPPLPGRPDTIADWTSLRLIDQSARPAEGGLDAVEAEPATGVNATTWHWGAAGSPLSMSTDGFAQGGALPKEGPNLTPGWHVVDIVYTEGFFAVYYDGRAFTSLSSDVVAGTPLKVLITTRVTPDTSQLKQQLGNVPQNSDSSPAGMAVKYVKIWSFK